MLPDREVARLVLDVADLIIHYRRARALRRPIAQGDPAPLPVHPTRNEMAVITALVQTYGAALLRNEFARLRNDLAECGAVAMAQRALLSDGWDDEGPALEGREVLRLQVARPPLEELCRQWPEIFLPEAQVALARLARRPPLRSEDEGDERDDA